jgi:hypothetical protein
LKAFVLLGFVGAMTACGAAGSSGTPVRTTDSSLGAAFANYHTFGFRFAGQPAAPFEVSARSFEGERRMRPLIVAELLRKGYEEQTGRDKPDFTVSFGLGYAKEANQLTEQTATPIEKGRMAIDAFDTSSNAQVWHGTAEAQVNPAKIDDSLLAAAVQQLLAPFPARGGAVTAAQAP